MREWFRRSVIVGLLLSGFVVALGVTLVESDGRRPVFTSRDRSQDVANAAGGVHASVISWLN